MLLHKYRRAMVRPGRHVLSDEVEVDESFYGAPTKGARGRGTARTIIAVAAECKPEGRIGRIRLARMKPRGRRSAGPHRCARVPSGGSSRVAPFYVITDLGGNARRQ